MQLSKGDIDRFWSKVSIRGDDECWPWKDTPTANGYGRLRFGGRGGIQVHAHRVALWLEKGPPPFGGAQACHLPVVCHNRSCCNPAHLYWGTEQDQKLDMKLDGTIGRGGGRSGEANKNAKLTDEQAHALRLLRGTLRERDAAALFNISPAQVHRIWAGESRKEF